MREINVSVLTDVIERLCIEANNHLPQDVKCAIQGCRSKEDGEIAQGVLDNIIENFEIADKENVPICQDTGMACVFLEIGLEIGQDVHLTGGDLAEAVDEGVRRGYTNGYLRKSVVKDPVRRGNTGDNTPAMLYTEIVPGEQILHGDRARRADQSHRRPQGIWKRKYEPDPDVQAFRGTAGDQGFHPGGGGDRRPQPLSAHGSRRGHWRHL